jgi:hypothetical protein
MVDIGGHRDERPNEVGRGFLGKDGLAAKVHRDTEGVRAYSDGVKAEILGSLELSLGEDSSVARKTTIWHSEMPGCEGHEKRKHGCPVGAVPLYHCETSIFAVHEALLLYH